jgi:hypothetical protein
MPESTVTRFTDTQFRVRVTEGRSETVHEVTLTDTDLQRYGGRAAAERLIQASFEFLLERESKASIKIWQRTTPVQVWVNAILTGSLRACSPQVNALRADFFPPPCV